MTSDQTRVVYGREVEAGRTRLHGRPMIDEPRNEVLLEAAARELVDALRPYRVLTRNRLAAVSGAVEWRDIEFDAAIKWAVEHGMLHALEPDLYELPRNRATG